MKISRLTLFAISCVVFSGCQQMPLSQSQLPVEPIAFADAPFQPYLRHGTARITGSAFLKTRAGDVKLGAGNPVELVPFVGYFAERWAAVQSRQHNPGPRDPRLAPYVRTTIADTTGNFEFDGVPAGDYIVLCQIYWEVPQYFAGQSYMVKTGGQAFAKVQIKDGETKRVIVTL